MLDNDEFKTPGQAAGYWWANKIRRPNAVQDNGGRDELNERIRPMLSQLQKKLCAKISEETIQKFQDEVTKIVDERLAFLVEMHALGRPNYNDHLDLVVDYEPWWLLREAYVAAGLQTRDHLLPYKTTMRISFDLVTVREGYDAAWVKVWER